MLKDVTPSWNSSQLSSIMRNHLLMHILLLEIVWNNDSENLLTWQIWSEPNSQNFHDARTHLVRWSSSLLSPKFLNDDSNVSKKGTPEEKGAQACRHCRSGKHWDDECKHACTSNFQQTRLNLASGELEEFEAQEAYDELYQDLSWAEGNQEEDNAHVLQTISEIPKESPLVKDKSDTPPDAHCNSIKHIINKFGTASGQGGSESSPNEEAPSPSPKTSRTTVGNQKIKIKLLHEAGKATTHLGISQLSNITPQALMKLQKHMSWPAGSTFLRTTTRCG